MTLITLANMGYDRHSVLKWTYYIRKVHSILKAKQTSTQNTHYYYNNNNSSSKLNSTQVVLMLIANSTNTVLLVPTLTASPSAAWLLFASLSSAALSAVWPARPALSAPAAAASPSSCASPQPRLQSGVRVSEKK